MLFIMSYIQVSYIRVHRGVPAPGVPAPCFTAVRLAAAVRTAVKQEVKRSASRRFVFNTSAFTSQRTFPVKY